MYIHLLKGHLQKMSSNQSRDTRGLLTSYNINILHIRNPNVVMWWSAAFPGFGHMLLCKYITAIMLIVWEFVININANLNQSILYSFLGDFKHAEAVLNQKWLLLYIPPYVFAMWDTRRLVYDLNKFTVIAEIAQSTVDRIKITPLEINTLSKKHAWLGALWSAFMPGLGHLYINRLPDGFFLIITWVTCIYYSNFLQAIHFTFSGQFLQATDVLDSRWFLFMPSIYVFTIYDSYMNCVEINREFHLEQSKYFKQNYQDKKFLSVSRLLTNGDDQMNIVASFEQTVTLELAIKELERIGVSRDALIAIPLSDKEKPQKIQHIMNNNGFYMMNTSLCVGSAMMTLGTIYGFRWTGGPIIWGLIGFFLGNAIGFLYDVIFNLAKIKLVRKRNKGPDVILIIHANIQQVPMIKEILFEYNALALSEVRFENEQGIG